MPRRPEVWGVLEAGTLETLRKYPKRIAEVSQLLFALEASAAAQRVPIQREINAALSQVTKPVRLDKWQRRVKVKHQDAPLSAAGSRLNGIGGRFNIGNVDPLRFTPFSGLYLAENQATAHAEFFGPSSPEDKATLEDKVFADRSSYAMYSVSGEIQDCLDIRDLSVLSDFLECIKSFSAPPVLDAWAKQLGLRKLQLVATPESLSRALYDPDWRKVPAYVNIPAECQIFGQIVAGAGIEGIIYPSVRDSGKSCAVVYPANLKHSGSWVALDDPTPPKVTGRLDRTNFDKMM